MTNPRQDHTHHSIAQAALLICLVFYPFAFSFGTATAAQETNSEETANIEQSNDTAPLKVGMVGRRANVVISGTELEVKPIVDRETPLVVRIDGVYPHGTDFRYDFEFYALEPGSYDLRDFLRRADGSSLENVLPMPVEAVTVLPAGQVEPNELRPAGSPSLGGYYFVLIFAGLLWVIGLVLIICWRRPKQRTAVDAQGRPLNLADRIRPLVERAVEGNSDPAELAELERGLLFLWRKRLNLLDEPAPVAMQQLKEHPDAGGLICQLELWLHRPGATPDVDLDHLLQPYRNIAAIDWSEALVAARAEQA